MLHDDDSVPETPSRAYSFIFLSFLFLLLLCLFEAFAAAAVERVLFAGATRFNGRRVCVDKNENCCLYMAMAYTRVSFLFLNIFRARLV